MHLHLVRVAARPTQVPRPAKVVQLEARRKARLDAARPQRQPQGEGAWTKRHTPSNTKLRLLVRMWRNRDTHRPQKPAVERP
jgi:hypothetical protein